jgi:hypothetical protein
MPDLIFTLVHVDTIDGDTEVSPLAKAFQSLDTAKAFAQEFANEWAEQFEEEPSELEWHESQGASRYWTANLGPQNEEQESCLIVTETELVG